MAVVLYQGAQRARVRAAAGRHRHVRRPVRSAERAGLRPGDRIVSIDGKPVETWEQFSMAIVPQGQARSLDRLRARRPADGRSASFPTAQGKFEIGDIGVQPVVHPADRRASARASRPRKPACKPATSILGRRRRAATSATSTCSPTIKSHAAPAAADDVKRGDRVQDDRRHAAADRQRW